MKIIARKYRQKTPDEYKAAGETSWSYYPGIEYMFEQKPEIVDQKYCCDKMKDNLQDEYKICIDIFDGKLISSSDDEYGPDIEDIKYCPWCGQQVTIEIAAV